jgi:DNA-directed RNA polymerase specialized sigma24 family protein
MTSDAEKSLDRGLVELEGKLRYYMELAKQGDSTGFAFVRHFAMPAIRAYVARKVEHADVDAEEIAELVFDKAEVSLSGYSPDRGKVLWWLRGIAWHTIGSYYRVHRPTLPLPADDEGVADSVPGPEELHNEATAEEERRALLKKLDSVLRKMPLRRMAKMAMLLTGRMPVADAAKSRARMALLLTGRMPVLRFPYTF